MQGNQPRAGRDAPPTYLSWACCGVNCRLGLDHAWRVQLHNAACQGRLQRELVPSLALTALLQAPAQSQRARNPPGPRACVASDGG